jgi:hypothetical protein
VALLYVLIGVVLLAVIWALVSAYTGRVEASTKSAVEPLPPPLAKFSEPIIPKAQDWKDAARTSVSKNFGRGGVPTGVAVDAGGVATSKHDDDDWLKNARPFEPRATKLDLDKDIDEAGETA